VHPEYESNAAAWQRARDVFAAKMLSRLLARNIFLGSTARMTLIISLTKTALLSSMLPRARLMGSLA